VRVGHGSAPLAVPDGTPLGGYAARDGASSGVLDQLQVDCISFGRFLLIVADVLCVDDELAATVRDALGTDDAWVCATHTHSGPDVDDTPRRRAIAAAAVAAAAAAVAAEEECAGRFHTGVLREVGSRRGVDGARARVTVDVVSCVVGDGRVRGVLAVVPVHPTVLPASSTLVSGDLTAAIRTALRRELDAPWVVVATGAAGDISTRRTRRAQTPAECRRLGAAAARQIATLARGVPAPIWELGEGVFAAAERRLVLPARRNDREALGALRTRLSEQHARAPDPASERTLETALQGVAVAEARPPARTVPLALSAARLGRLALFGIGGEPFHSLAAAVRDRSDGPTALLGYANGHAGYLADEAAYATAGYEVLASPFRPDAGAATVAALIDLLTTTRRTE
jgi:neutral ceramidase